jgi:hypothetical protein
MNTERKFGLFIISFAVVLVLLNAAPAVVSLSGVEDSPVAMQNTDFIVSDTITSLATSIDFSGTQGSGGWFISDVVVTFSVLSSADSYTTAYSLDGVNWLTYAGAFVISTEGLTIIYYNSTDSNGLVESTKTDMVQIDKTPPELFLETENIPGIGTNVTITAIEDVSYLVDIAYSLNGGRWIRYSGPIQLTKEGTQPVYYRATDAAGNTVSKLDYVEVVILPAVSSTEVTYSGDLTGVYSDPVILEATLIDTLTGSPVPDRWLVFTLGTQTISALTDSEGVAHTSLVLDQPAGSYDLDVSFEGDDSYLAASVSHEFTIMREQALTYYSGLTIIDRTDSTMTLMATVLGDDDGYWGDLTQIYVTFSIYLLSDPTTPVQVIDSVSVSTTDLDGIGIATVEIPSLPENEYIVVVSLDPNQNQYYWSPDSEAAIVTIYKQGRGYVSGFGWIKDSDRNKGHFVFAVKDSCRGGLAGFIYYTLRDGDVVYFVRSTEITGFMVYDDHAFFEASVSIDMYNLKTCEKVKLEDGYRLRVDAWVSMKRHGKDIFQIQIFDKHGIVVYEAGFDPLGYVHKGNIVIHGHYYPRHHHKHYHHRHYHKHYWYHRCHCHRMKHW